MRSKRIMVVGNGGREHAITLALAESAVENIICSPGNYGMSQIKKVECFNPVPGGFPACEDLARLAESAEIDLTVGGGEVPLINGLGDVFRHFGLRFVGPNQQAALLTEGSKVRAKELMDLWHIPTAPFRWFNNADEAKAYINELGEAFFRNTPGVYIKADGLAAGKGAFEVLNVEQGLWVIDHLMGETRALGDAGARVVIEHTLVGPEISFTTCVDANGNLFHFPVSQDNKRLKGRMTGGVGSYAPVSFVDDKLYNEIVTTIVEPAVNALATERTPFEGFLYTGICLTDDGPKVFEFNCRLGDTEAETLLPLLEEGCLLTLLDAVADGNIPEVASEIRFKAEYAVSVVCASPEYPDPSPGGLVITGIEDAQAIEGVEVFFGRAHKPNDEIVTGGGRELIITGLGASITEAMGKAYRGVGEILFNGETPSYKPGIGFNAHSD